MLVCKEKSHPPPQVLENGDKRMWKPQVTLSVKKIPKISLIVQVTAYIQNST